MRVAGVILARGGSKGVPNKNLLLLLGRPVLTYTFEHALCSPLIERVFLSSEDERALCLAEEWGIETIRRPEALAIDSSPIQEALNHALDELEGRHAYRPEALVVLYGNIPVRSETIIDDCIAELMRTGCDSVRSFSPVDKHHPFWMSRIEGGRVIPFFENEVYRRQDLPPLFIHDGAAVVLRSERVRRTLRGGGLFEGDARGVIQDSHLTVDIDTPRDLKLAELFLRERLPVGSPSHLSSP